MLKSIRQYIVKNKLYMLLLIPLGFLLLYLAKTYPDFTETYYTQGFYRIASSVIGGILSLVPFSIYEFMIIGLILWGVFFLIWCIFSLVKTKDGPLLNNGFGLKKLGAIFSKIAAAASVFYFVFVIFCGINYYRHEFADLSGLEIKKTSVSELTQLCDELVITANQKRSLVKTDENGIMKLDGDIKDTSDKARISMNLLSRKYDAIFQAWIKPKSVLNSKAMSYMNITGVYSPFTIEANINTDILDYDIPATMCHELAHTRGFMREDEANFIAYLACQASPEITFQYSGTMLALVHSMNRLYEADEASFERIYAKYSEGVKADLKANSEYWKQFEGAIAEVSSSVNDGYLKANSQADGVNSYGKMVDLLLAHRRDAMKKAIK